MKKLYLWSDLQGEQHALIADSLLQAKQTLFMQDSLFVKIKYKQNISKQSFKVAELIIVTKQLATMLKAGLPIVNCLTLIADEHPLLPWQYVLNDIKRQLMAGYSLSQSFANHPTVFPKLYQEIVATGELTGKLDLSFEKLAEQLEKTQLLQKRIIKALRYPCFLLCASIAIILVMLLFVLPKFLDVYQSFDAELPAFTLLIIAISDSLQHHFVMVLMCLFSFGGFYQFYLKKHHQITIDKYFLSLPIIGKIMLATNLAYLFHTLAITQKSGITLIDGLKSAERVVYNQYLKVNIGDILQSITQGMPFSETLHHYPTLYPKLCGQLILVGEESGTLDLMLDQLYHFYQQQSEELMDHLSQKIEPLMMSVMAIVIGGLVIAMYLPIFQLGSVIH